MATAASILQSLKAKGSEKTRATYARHGMALDRTLGVSVADLKKIAKSIKGQQELACELYATGIMDAMYLAGLVANGGKMSAARLQQWAEGAIGLPMISEYTVPWVTVENAAAQELANAWIRSDEEQIVASGWCTWSGLVATRPDTQLHLGQVAGLLEFVEQNIGSAKNRARYTMNSFVISVGGYVKPISEHAKAVAGRLGNVSVDVGDTACKVPLATDYIAKIEAMGRLGQKRKTIRC
jgi:3-methyladenine DNA glycosylase AlkD